MPKNDFTVSNLTNKDRHTDKTERKTSNTAQAADLLLQWIRIVFLYCFFCWHLSFVGIDWFDVRFVSTGTPSYSSAILRPSWVSWDERDKQGEIRFDAGAEPRTDKDQARANRIEENSREKDRDKREQ